MKRLGYDRSVAQGGDWGAHVTTWLGKQRPEGLVAIHLNLPTLPPPRSKASQSRKRRPQSPSSRHSVGRCQAMGASRARDRRCSATASSILQPGRRPGSTRNSQSGPTATGTRNPSSRAMPCLTTSCFTGWQRPPHHRQGCMRRPQRSTFRDRCWISRSASAYFRERSTFHRGYGVSEPIASSSIGTGRQEEATSRRSSSRALFTSELRARFAFIRT